MLFVNVVVVVVVVVVVCLFVRLDSYLLVEVHCFLIFFCVGL